MVTAPSHTGTGAPERRPPARRRGTGLRAVGVVGELLFTAGALLGLFVIWQVWWTDVVAGEEQRSAVAEIEESFEPAVERPGEPRTDPPPTVDPASVIDDDDGGVAGGVAGGEDTGAAGGDGDDGAGSGDGDGRGGSAAPARGFATLWVPRFGADYRVPIAEGVGIRDVLNAGAAGHYPETALPGEVGNFALAAHRQTYGAPFRHVDLLRQGDALVVETAEAWLVYEVTSDYVVTPDRVEVIAPVPGSPGASPTDRLITLTTCHPLWSTQQRWITHGELVEWVPRSDGMPVQLLEAR